MATRSSRWFRCRAKRSASAASGAPPSGSARRRQRRSAERSASHEHGVCTTSRRSSTTKRSTSPICTVTRAPGHGAAGASEPKTRGARRGRRRSERAGRQHRARGRLQERAARRRRAARRSRSRSVSRRRIDQAPARHHHRRHARAEPRGQARRLHSGHEPHDRLHLHPRRDARAGRQAVPRHGRVRRRLRPVRLEARLHRPVRSAALLRHRRQRDRHRDEGERHRKGPRHRARHRFSPAKRHLPHDGLGRAEPRPLHRAPHSAAA